LLQQTKFESFPRSQIDLLVNQWLKHRQEVLVHYSQLSVSQQNQTETLQEFCQILMDYVATGHFKMFEKLADCYSNSQSSSLELDGNLLKKILLTTDVVLDFNDKYTNTENLETLPFDLSHLGESLANRMDWEDEFIKVCLQ